MSNTKRDTRMTCPERRTIKRRVRGGRNLKATRTNFSSARSLASIGRGSGALSTDICSSSLIWVSSRPTCISCIPSSSSSCASILVCSAIIRGTYDDVDGALRKSRKKGKEKKKFEIYASDVEGLTRTKTETVDGRSGEDFGVSVMEIPEFSDCQLFDATLGLWRYPEARYGSTLLSGPYGGGGATERIRGLHVRRNINVGVEQWAMGNYGEDSYIFPILYTPNWQAADRRPKRDITLGKGPLDYSYHYKSFNIVHIFPHMNISRCQPSRHQRTGSKDQWKTLTAPGGINSSLSGP
jgi:hypothetical protein